MIDIKDLRENPNKYKANTKRKGRDESIVDEVLQLDSSWRALKVEADNLRKERNQLSKSISEAKKKGEDPKELFTKAKEIPQQLKQVEEDETTTLKTLQEKLSQIPNIISDKVPQGKDEQENVELSRHGPNPQKKEVKAHQEWAEENDFADFESSGRTSGTGFYYIEDELALLNRALLQYALDVMMKKGFRYVETPLLLRGDVMNKVVDLRDQEEMIYKIENEDLYLIGTSEHSLIGRFIGQTIEADNLPIKHTSYSMCFRKEKGSHGLDERGLFRTHQFNKIEMIVICKPEESIDFYKQMQEITLEIFTSLELPTRVLQLCTGDLGDTKYDQIDVEVYSPRRDEWIEVGSCSNLTDAQARSLGIRVQDKNEYYTPHTLNNTAIATSRALVSFLENNQQEDGSVSIPKVLQPYMGGKDKIGGK